MRKSCFFIRPGYFGFRGFSAFGWPPSPGRGGHAVSEPPRSDQESSVPNHPVLWPDGEPVHVPAALQRLPCGRLSETALIRSALTVLASCVVVVT